MMLTLTDTGGGSVRDLYRAKRILKKEGHQSIGQHYVLLYGQGLAGTITSYNRTMVLSTALIYATCKNNLKKQPAGIVSVMDWPAQSQDPNPIELVHRVRSDHQPIQPIGGISKAWDDISSG